MTKPLKIGLLSPFNPFDLNSFSGTPFFMRRELEARPDVVFRVLGSHRPPATSLVGKVLRRGVERIVPPRPFSLEPHELEGLDAIFTTVGFHTLPELDLSCAAPMIFFTDATPAFLREFYKAKVFFEDGIDEREARVLKRMDHVVYSSDYMRKRALAEFSFLDPAKVHAIPFGANLDNIPTAPPEKPPLDRIELLYVGTSWKRKGGDIALGALRALRAGGMDAHLTIVGKIPKKIEEEPGLTQLGFINKNRPNQVARLAAALNRAHLFILPTRADCTPMVVAEANLHGLPVLISDVGGVASLMSEGENGRMLPLSAGAEDWAAAVRDLVADEARYRALSQTSHAHALNRLTWDAWARDALALVRGTASKGA